MSTSHSSLDWHLLETQLDAILDLPLELRAVRLAELLDKDESAHAHALRQWLADIEQAERDPLAHTHDGERVGPWRAMHRLGRGGMGDVWMAERSDGTYEKRVAIKFLYGDTPKLRARLEMERHLLAQLQHPNIPRLIDGGVTAGGQPYLVTDFVEGMSLDLWNLTPQAADFDTRIRLFRQVAAAVAHAHEHSVAHRDLKPNNVLVDREDCAHLLDFGVARLLNEERRADTMQPLTLEYASPEQVRNGKASVRTDIYGLGALFYFLVARKPPFDFHDLPIAACVKRISEDTPARPSMAGDVPNLPRALAADLDAIALKALAKSPDDRYANVEDMLRDLDDAFAHRPIEARKLDGGVYRARRFVRRNALALGVSAAIGLSLATGMVLALWQAHLASEQRDVAQAARAVAETERTNARTQAARSDMTVDFLLSVLGSAAPNNQAIKIDDLLALAAQRVTQAAESHPELYPRLFDTLMQAYEQRGNARALEPLLLALLTDPKKNLPPAVNAELSCSLADLEWTIQNWNEARRWAETGLQQTAALAPEQARDIQAGCRRILAESQLLSGKLDQTLKFYREAVVALGDPPHDTRKNAQLLGTYGVKLAMADDLVEARAQFRKSIDMYTRLGRENSADALATLGQMAYCTARVGLVVQGLDEMQRNIELNLRATGPTADIAMMMYGQAQITLDLSRPQEAAALLERSQTMVRDFAPEQTKRFRVQWAALGVRIATLSGDERLREAKIAETREALDDLKLPPEARLRSALREAEIASATLIKAASPEETFDRFEHAEGELRAMGSGSKSALARVMLGGAEAALDIGRDDLAGKKVAQAREIFGNSVDPESWQLGVYDAVAAVVDWRAGKDRPLARAGLERALARMQAALGADHPRVARWRDRLRSLDAS
ncbi:serine/threonine-protein kinase [Dokdonella sp.]|uniref:serine/threonine protein kinase n=1 Tax=Dokdonella sp. TaxID=2291710 RepID=UPI001B2D2521|nr:serine/threonine-protein kinase [Dokdonella sp.]MBO9664653.1 serine/threonine protein kinase [Dokdonella sp.]